MKKTFSWVTAILTGFLLMVTSCTNPTQITFNKGGNYTNEGLSTLTAKINSTPDYSRTIFPNDWTDDLKGGLLYKLTATPNPPEATPTQTAKAGAGIVFTYEDIVNGKASMDLDPVAWDLHLKAYLPSDMSKTEINKTALVLEADVTNVNLASGSTTVKFDLKVPEINPDTTANATGKVDIQVYFYSEEVLNTIDLSIGKHLTAAIALANPIKPDELAPDANLTTKNGKVTVVDAAEKYYSAHLSGEVPAGVHTFKAIFKDVTPNIILTNEETVYVDGGNLSEKVIYIPKGSYNKIPESPKGLYAETEFAPVGGNKLTLNKYKNIFAQEITTTGTLDEVTTALDAAAKGNKYNITFNWQDKSSNEKGFKLILTTTSNGTDPVKELVLLPKDLTSIEIKNKDETQTVADSGINYVKGDLLPGSESLTISLPTGLFVKDVKLRAYNDLGNNKADAVLLQSNSTDENGTPNAGKQTTAIGKFTIAYNLIDPDKKNIPVTYYPGPATKGTGFILAYDFGDKTTDLISKVKTNNIPYITYNKYNFGGWYYKNSTDVTTPVKLVKVNTKHADPETTADFDKLNTNITVYSSWLSTASITVTFPNYSHLKDLQAVGNQNIGEVIEPTVEQDKNLSITVSVPATVDNGTVTTPAFKVYDPAGAEITTDESITFIPSGSVDKGTLVWDIKNSKVTTDFFNDTKTTHVGGIYRIYVSYLYTEKKNGTETGRKYTIDGNLYVKLSK